MVAFALCSATSFRVFHIFFACGWMQDLTFLTYHAVSTTLFFVKITNCVDFSSLLPSFFHSEAPQLQLLLLPCLFGLHGLFHVHYHYFVIFLLLHICLTFLLCLQFEIQSTFLYWKYLSCKIIYRATINYPQVIRVSSFFLMLFKNRYGIGNTV